MQTESPVTGAGDVKSPSQPAAGAPITDEIYTQDGDYIKDVEVNDLRNRYTLTKGSTQKMVNIRPLIPLMLLEKSSLPAPQDLACIPPTIRITYSSLMAPTIGVCAEHRLTRALGLLLASCAATRGPH